MNSAKMLSSLIAAAALAFAGLTTAQTAPAAKAAPKALAPEPVDVKLERQKITVVNGKEVAESSAVAKPGDILQDTVTYTNKSKNAVTKLEANLPIPPNTELVLGSLNPNTAKASIDGVNFAALPLKRKVKQANGVEIEVNVPIVEVRYLRWYPGDLAAGKALVFSARFKVSDK